MYLRRLIYTIVSIIFFLVVFSYGVYKAIPLIEGPKITLDRPNGNRVEGTSVEIVGTVERAKFLYINGIPTTFSKAGIFESRLAVYPGSNILIIEAVDRFGRVRTISKNLLTAN